MIREQEHIVLLVKVNIKTFKIKKKNVGGILLPAEGVTLITSTPSGKASSRLYRRFVVRLSRLALCKFEVHGLHLGVAGELNMSKLNCDVSTGDVELASVSAEVKSEDKTGKKENSKNVKDFEA